MYQFRQIAARDVDPLRGRLMLIKWLIMEDTMTRRHRPLMRFWRNFHGPRMRNLEGAGGFHSGGGRFRARARHPIRTRQPRCRDLSLSDSRSPPGMDLSLRRWARLLKSRRWSMGTVCSSLWSGEGERIWEIIPPLGPREGGEQTQAVGADRKGS